MKAITCAAFQKVLEWGDRLDTEGAGKFRKFRKQKITREIGRFFKNKKNKMEENQKEEKEEKKEESKKDYFLPVSILIAAVLISGSLIYSAGKKSVSNLGGSNEEEKVEVNLDQKSKLPAGVFDILKIKEDDVILGDPKAPLTIIEYGDYQCPFCARFFEETESLIRENYVKNGKAKMIFRNYQFLGPESLAAAEAAECAREQKQFWAYHDAIYSAELVDGRENNGNFNEEFFLNLAEELGLNVDSFKNCLQSHKYRAEIEKEIVEAQRAGINSTPTTFIGEEKMVGALPYVQFKEVIDRYLK